MRELLSVTKALSDENRVRALMALGGGELCLCQIIELLGLTPSPASKHMNLLHQAGLVQRRKDGRWHYFRLSNDSDSEPALAALVWLAESLADDPRIAEDSRRLARIQEKDLLELSACYRN